MPEARPEAAFVKLEYLDMCFVDRIEKLIGEIREAAIYARAMKDVWLKYFPPEKCLPRAHRIKENDS